MPNTSFYMPRNPMQIASMFFGKGQTEGSKPIKIESLTIEILVRFKTNLKLALAGVDDQTRETVYLGSVRDEEYHFVKFEGCLPPVEMTLDAIKKLAMNMEIEDWTITDFDNCLEGNPHI